MLPPPNGVLERNTGDPITSVERKMVKLVDVLLGRALREHLLPISRFAPYPGYPSRLISTGKPVLNFRADRTFFILTRLISLPFLRRYTDSLA